MKLKTIVFAFMCLSFLSMFQAIKIKDKANGPTIIGGIKLETVKDIFKKSFKSMVSIQEDSPVGVCLNQVTQLKYNKYLVSFWGTLNNIFSWGSARPFLTFNEIHDFIKEAGKEEFLSDGKSCITVLEDALISDDELKAKGKKMKDDIAPELDDQKQILPEPKKGYITAFTGVHRFTKESSILIPKLNKKK